MPKVYLTTKQKEEAKREQELSKLKGIIADHLFLVQKHSGLTQEQTAKKYGVSPRTIRKVLRGESVQISYISLLNMLLDSGLTILEKTVVEN